MNRKRLPTLIPVALNSVVVISFVWFVVDVIRGHIHHSDANYDYALVNAMSLVWLGFGVLALLNSLAIHKFNEYLDQGNAEE